MKKILAAFFVLHLVGCAVAPKAPEAPAPVEKPLPEISVPKDELPFMKAEWSVALIGELKKGIGSLNKAQDDMAARWCPKYKEMNIDQQAVVWAYLADGMIVRESNCVDGDCNEKDDLFKTCSAMTESDGNVSQGLFQMTYGDGYKCPNKKSEGNLCEPIVGIKCGVSAMISNVARDSVVAGGGYEASGAPAPKGLARYWSVVRIPDPQPRIVHGKKVQSAHHLKEIMAKTAKAPGCQ